jgi:hypothetical protein
MGRTAIAFASIATVAVAVALGCCSSRAEQNDFLGAAPYYTLELPDDARPDSISFDKSENKVAIFDVTGRVYISQIKPPYLTKVIKLSQKHLYDTLPVKPIWLSNDNEISIGIQESREDRNPPVWDVDTLSRRASILEYGILKQNERSRSVMEVATRAIFIYDQGNRRPAFSLNVCPIYPASIFNAEWIDQNRVLIFGRGIPAESPECKAGALKPERALWQRAFLQIIDIPAGRATATYGWPSLGLLIFDEDRAAGITDSSFGDSLSVSPSGEFAILDRKKIISLRNLSNIRAIKYEERDFSSLELSGEIAYSKDNQLAFVRNEGKEFKFDTLLTITLSNGAVGRSRFSSSGRLGVELSPSGSVLAKIDGHKVDFYRLPR